MGLAASVAWRNLPLHPKTPPARQPGPPFPQGIAKTSREVGGRGRGRVGREGLWLEGRVLQCNGGEWVSLQTEVGARPTSGGSRLYGLYGKTTRTQNRGTDVSFVFGSWSLARLVIRALSPKPGNCFRQGLGPFHPKPEESEAESRESQQRGPWLLVGSCPTPLVVYWGPRTLFAVTIFQRWCVPPSSV